MNPIEHIWAMMVRRIKTEPTWNIDQFRNEVHVAWEWCIGKEDYQSTLADSMNDRFKDVIAYEGNWTKY